MGSGCPDRRMSRACMVLAFPKAFTAAERSDSLWEVSRVTYGI